MAKRKKDSKVQKRRGATARGKTRKVAKAAKVKATKRTAAIAKAAKVKATKRTAARAKPARVPVKKAARRIKQSVAPSVETVAAEVIKQPVAVTDEASTTPAV
jgi:hypothetical protein